MAAKTGRTGGAEIQAEESPRIVPRRSDEEALSAAEQQLARLPATSILAGQLTAALANEDVGALHDLFDAQEQRTRDATAEWQAIRERTRTEFARTLRSPSTALPAQIICPGCDSCKVWWMKVLSDGTRVQFNLRTTGIELYAERISLFHRYELECVSCLGYECSRCKRCFTDTELKLAACRGEEALRRDILAGRCF